MNFLIAYDISDPTRLRNVAKRLERSARRVQKSLFIFTGSRKQLDQVLVMAAQEILPTVDRLQAWPIRTSSKSARIDQGAGLPERGLAAIISPQAYWVIEAIDDPHACDDEPLLFE